MHVVCIYVYPNIRRLCVHDHREFYYRRDDLNVAYRSIFPAYDEHKMMVSVYYKLKTALLHVV